MAKLYSSSLTKEVVDVARLQLAREPVPIDLGTTIHPVIDINPKHARRCNLVRSVGVTNSTGTTIYTTPANQDFYLAGGCLSVVKDATSTSTYTRLRIFVEGVARDVVVIPGLSLVAQQMGLNLTIQDPIKVDRNSIISLGNETAVANITSNGSIWGYLVDPEGNV